MALIFASASARSSSPSEATLSGGIRSQVAGRRAGCLHWTPGHPPAACPPSRRGRRLVGFVWGACGCGLAEEERAVAWLVLRRRAGVLLRRLSRPSQQFEHTPVAGQSTHDDEQHFVLTHVCTPERSSMDRLNLKATGVLASWSIPETTRATRSSAAIPCPSPSARNAWPACRVKAPPRAASPAAASSAN